MQKTSNLRKVATALTNRLSKKKIGFLVYIERDDLERLNKYCKRAKISRSSFITGLIAEVISKRRSNGRARIS
jgi:hypothetical protein